MLHPISNVWVDTSPPSRSNAPTQALSSTQFWHCLPQNNIIYHRLKTQSHKPTPCFRCHTWVQAITHTSAHLAMYSRFPWPPPWISDASPKSRFYLYLWWTSYKSEVSMTSSLGSITLLDFLRIQETHLLTRLPVCYNECRRIQINSQMKIYIGWHPVGGVWTLHGSTRKHSGFPTWQPLSPFLLVLYGGYLHRHGWLNYCQWWLIKPPKVRGGDRNENSDPYLWLVASPHP